jgi:hypothetical protein
MDLKNKLKNIQNIYYLNLDERPDRRDYMESQFDKWKIKNFTRVSASKFKISNYDEWKDKVILNPNTELYFQSPRHILEVCTALSYFDLIKNWLETTNDEHMIIMEDDYDLSMIEYWHFDWEYLMNNIPYDWDVIQLGFENKLVIPCFLHPTLDKYGTGALLINRDYAKKIVKLHYTSDGRYNLYQKLCSYTWTQQYECPSVTIDYAISKNGKSYSLPLIYINPDIGSYEVNYHRPDQQWLYEIKRIYHFWWKDLRDNYTLKEFFTYGKPNDKIIKVSVNN